MKAFGARLGALCNGGEVVELVGDVGAGKTTLTKGMAIGLSIDESIQSPSFTISRVYQARDDLTLYHYDFYRLPDAGIMADDLRETLANPRAVTVIEWSGIVEGALPEDRLTLTFISPSETSRDITLKAGGAISRRLVAGL